MRYILPIIFYGFFASSPHAATSSPDTVAPHFRSVDPPSYSILRNNLVRLRADVIDSGSGVDSVRVIFSHYPFEDSTQDQRMMPETLAVMTQPPFESVHNFSNVQDFDMWRA